MIFQKGSFEGYFLFRGWLISTPQIYIGTCLFIVCCGLLNEVTRAWRQHLYRCPLFFNLQKYVYKSKEYKLFVCVHGASMIRCKNRKRLFCFKEEREHSGTNIFGDNFPQVQYHEIYNRGLNVIGNQQTNQNEIPISNCGCIDKIHFDVRDHLLQSLLHIIQTGLNLLAMSIVMTMNVWFGLSILIGLSIGYFLFDKHKFKVTTGAYSDTTFE